MAPAELVAAGPPAAAVAGSAGPAVGAVQQPEQLFKVARGVSGGDQVSARSNTCTGISPAAGARVGLVAGDATIGRSVGFGRWVCCWRCCTADRAAVAGRRGG